MNLEEQKLYDNYKSAQTELVAAQDEAEKTKMSVLGGIFTLATNWNDPKAGMQMLSLMFAAAQNISAQSKVYIKSEDANLSAQELLNGTANLNKQPNLNTVINGPP